MRSFKPTTIFRLVSNFALVVSSAITVNWYLLLCYILCGPCTVNFAIRDRSPRRNKTLFLAPRDFHFFFIPANASSLHAQVNTNTCFSLRKRVPSLSTSNLYANSRFKSAPYHTTLPVMIHTHLLCAYAQKQRKLAKCDNIQQDNINCNKTSIDIHVITRLATEKKASDETNARVLETNTNSY